jgi:D-alanyl-D-alanine carboxypeptidase (penicillin-binding protein 5/6)
MYHMHVISPARYQPQTVQRSKKPIGFIFVFLLLVAGIYNYARPLPVPTVNISTVIPGSLTNPPIAWPSDGQAAAAANGYGLLGTSGAQTPLATASITKVIAALCVLQKQPLKLDQTGPTYTINANDVAIYDSYVAQNGSVVAVAQGEKLTEYQALEALMLPSANNIADSLVKWVFGSQAAYKTYATDFLQQHNMNQTHIGSDASGFDPSTASTASDLTSLGLLALKDPVLMEIAGKESTVLPVAGTVTNYDSVLGVNGITGLKTGNNDQDTGAFLFTAQSKVGSQTVNLTGAVMGAPDLGTALQNSTQLVASLQKDFEQTIVVNMGKSVGTLKTAWGQSSSMVVTQDVQLVRWKATPISSVHDVNPKLRSGVIGTIKVSAGKAQASSDIRLQHTIAGPSFWWRLTRH